MVRPAHTLVEFSGVFGAVISPIEEWSFGLRCSGTVLPENLATVALACETAYGEYFPPVMRQDVTLTRTRVANIKGQDSDDVAGRIARNADGSYQLADEAGSITGSGTSGATLPTHVALAVSLTTARAGATGRGRIFVPFPSVALSTSRLVETADAQGLATRFRDFVTTINAIGILGPVSVVSSKGYATPVNGVRVGRVPDTQRSRRNRRDEGYASASF